MAVALGQNSLRGRVAGHRAKARRRAPKGERKANPGPKRHEPADERLRGYHKGAQIAAVAANPTTQRG